MQKIPIIINYKFKTICTIVNNCTKNKMLKLIGVKTLC